MPSPSLLRRASAAAAACCLAAAAFAQGAPAPGGPNEPGGPDLRDSGPSRIVPSGPATWEAIDRRGAVTHYELGTDGGWYYWPPFLQWRFLDTSQWVTGDPIVEVHIYPPYSGSTTNIEAFMLQIPTQVPAPVEDRALIIGFHGASLSTAQIFGFLSGNTGLADYCSQQGWFLLAPSGVHLTNMANKLSQDALEVTLAFFASLFEFNWEKVYTLGFSMGGLNATSFAFRHQDPYTPRVAGIIYHSGTTDVVRDYEEASAWAKANIFEDPLVFGASPAEDPFAYDRVNPVRFDAAGTGFLEEHFQLDSVKHTPFYLHANYNDPTKYPEWTMTLANTLAGKGFTLKTDYVTTSEPEHWLHTIDYDDAFSYVTQWQADSLPTQSEVFADRPARYLWSELLSNPDPQVARYKVKITAATNDFTVTGTHHVGSVAFDLGLMGLDPAQPVAFTAASGDGTPDTYVLRTYPQAPSQVLVDGGPPAAWSYDAVTGSVSVTPNATGASAHVKVFP